MSNDPKNIWELMALANQAIKQKQEAAAIEQLQRTGQMSEAAFHPDKHWSEPQNPEGFSLYGWDGLRQFNEQPSQKFKNKP